MQKLIMPVGRFLLKSPAKGAETPTYLASSRDVDGVTGCFFVNSKRKKSAPQSYDRDDALRLWDVSTELVGGI